MSEANKDRNQLQQEKRVIKAVRSENIRVNKSIIE